MLACAVSRGTDSFVLGVTNLPWQIKQHIYDIAIIFNQIMRYSLIEKNNKLISCKDHRKMIKVILLLAFSCISQWVYASTGLPESQGAVILTVSGNITHTNSKQIAEFDLTMLQSMPQTTIVTKNPMDRRYESIYRSKN